MITMKKGTMVIKPDKCLEEGLEMVMGGKRDLEFHSVDFQSLQRLCDWEYTIKPNLE